MWEGRRKAERVRGTRGVRGDNNQTSQIIIRPPKTSQTIIRQLLPHNNQTSQAPNNQTSLGLRRYRTFHTAKRAGLASSLARGRASAFLRRSNEGRGPLSAWKSDQRWLAWLRNPPIRLRPVAVPCDQPPLPSLAFQGRPASPPPSPSRPRPSRAASAREGARRGAGIPPQSAAAQGTGAERRRASCCRSSRSVFRQGQAYPLFDKAASEILPLQSSQPFPPPLPLIRRHPSSDHCPCLSLGFQQTQRGMGGFQ